MNMLALSWGETTIVVDAGVMFPDPELLGVDRIIPDLTYLQQQGRAAALVLTHGHEDHIGARAARAAARRRTGLRHAADAGARRAEARGARDRTARQLIAGAAARARHGRTVRRSNSSASRTACPTAWRWRSTRRSASSSTPATSRSTRRRSTASTSTCTASRELGAQGVLALFADSTNIDRRGFTGSELDVVEAFEEIFTSASGKLIVAAFASSIYRMQILVDLAAQFDRKVAFVGRGMMQNSEIAQRLGYLRIPAGVQIRDSDVGNYPAQDVLCLATGSQGEPMSALSRIAIDDHRYVKVGADDTVGAVRARDSRQREGDRPRHEPPRAARRRRDLRGHQARPRVGARQRRGAEADAVAGAAALLRPGARRIPPAVAARAHRRARVRRPRSAAGDSARRERRRASSSTTTARASPARRRSGAC